MFHRLLFLSLTALALVSALASGAILPENEGMVAREKERKSVQLYIIFILLTSLNRGNLYLNICCRKIWIK